MRNLGDTIGRLAARRAAVDFGNPPRNHLANLDNFGSNPGALVGCSFAPADLPTGAPLVVALHGCTQTAAGYDHGAGWSALAAEAGFAVLFAEQTRANNPNLCFNWFNSEDISRTGGEAESIRQMTETMVRRHGLDRRRLFVTGLSAGGAMTLTMLATAPDLFAAGAVIAGVPHGTAVTVPEAFDRMRGHGLPSPARLATLVRNAAPQPASVPRLSIWQGTADNTVDPANAQAIASAWQKLHGLHAKPTHTEIVQGHTREVWRDSNGAEMLEFITIAGMGHGVPLATSGAESLGNAGPYILDAGISSTRRIAAFFGIAPLVAQGKASAEPVPPRETGVESMINTALRQAGLIR